MSGRLANSAAPNNAVTFWVDRTHLFCELPSQNGPVVLSYPRTTQGFAKALATLFGLHEAEGGDPYYQPQLPSTIPDKNGITDQQRQDARDILRRLKVIG